MCTPAVQLYRHTFLHICTMTLIRQEVEYLRHSCRDNYRPFFEQAFPLLLRRVFGYDGASWLTTLAHNGKEADISALLDLLSPTGADKSSKPFESEQKVLCGAGAIE